MNMQDVEALEYMADLFRDMAGDQSTDDGWKTIEMREVYFRAMAVIEKARGGAFV